MENKIPVKCPYCGCDTIVEMTKVTRTLLVSGIVEDTTASGKVVYDKDEDLTDWGNDTIDYSTTSDPFAYDCWGCGHRWKSLDQFVEEMENKYCPW